MRVPPGEWPVRLGSHPGGGPWQRGLSKPRGQCLALGEVSKLAGRNANESRAGIESEVMKPARLKYGEGRSAGKQPAEAPAAH